MPFVEYTEAEHRTWALVWEKLHAVYDEMACAEFRRSLALFEKEAGYSSKAIPQLEDVNRVLKREQRGRFVHY